MLAGSLLIALWWMSLLVREVGDENPLKCDVILVNYGRQTRIAN